MKPSFELYWKWEKTFYCPSGLWLLFLVADGVPYPRILIQDKS